ncbi:MAG: type VI secretion system-associated FHA domain protein TagH [Gammaproteobacteria bacterium]|nr:MAG: type VI secretion system-associated FHA domain protein TagH [Gammaproteobacteria bacterium]
MKLVLSVTTAPDGCGMEGQQEEFSVSGGSFGRGPANQWILPDPSRHVSSTHGRVAYDSGKFYLEDVSTNGTYLNDEEFPIGPGNKRELVSGDILLFGDYTLQVELIEESEQPIASNETLGFALSPAESAALEKSFDDLDRWLDPVPQPTASAKPVFDSSARPDGQRQSPVFTDLEHSANSLDPLDALSNKTSPADNFDFALNDLAKPSHTSQGANFNRLDLPHPIPGDGNLPENQAPPKPTSKLVQKTDDPLASLANPAAIPTASPAKPLATAKKESDGLDEFLGLDKGIPPVSKLAGAEHVSTTESVSFGIDQPGKELFTPSSKSDNAGGKSASAPVTPSVKDKPIPSHAQDDFPDTQKTGHAAKIPVVPIVTQKTHLPSDSDEIPLTSKDILSDFNMADNTTKYRPSNADSSDEKIINAQFLSGFDAPITKMPSTLLEKQATHWKATPDSGTKPRTADALAASLGLDNLSSTQLSVLPTTVAKVVKEAVRGLITSLRARDRIKNELRMNMTMIQAAENNPLKFSVTVEDALESMFAKTGKAYLPAADAISEGFADLADHQVALFDAMRFAYEKLIENFDPLVLEDKIGAAKRRGFFGVRKKQTWKSYKDFYASLIADKEDSFKKLFADVFTEAYEKRINELKTNRKN